MNRILNHILTSSILAMLPFTVFAFNDGDFTFEKNGTNAIVTGYINEKQTYTIPSYVEYGDESLRVNAIGKKAFYGNSRVVKIDLPSTLETIGEQAFYNCDNLAVVSLPDAVISIGANAFSLCSNLKKIEINSNSSLTSIGRSAFSYSGIGSVFIPKNVSSIAKSVFANCENLETMSVDADNSTYDSRNNSNAIFLKHDNILVFGCKGTKKEIPEGVVSIGENAFYGSGLSEVTLPSTLTTIEESAFYNCELTSVNIPDAVESIGDNAFSLCSKLETINISNSSSLLSIGRSAFSYTGLTSIKIPKSVLTIGKNAFANCESLSNIQVETGNTFYSSPDNCNAILQGDKLIVGCSGTTIPESASSIGEGAFYGSGFGGDIVIPSTINKIEEQGFYSCDKITSITIEEGLTSIGRYAFSLCSNVKKVQLPSTLKSIDKYAFHYCDKLDEIKSLITKLFGIDDTVFDGLYETATLSVPKGMVETYKQTAGWKNFIKISTGIASPTIAMQRIYSDNGVIYIECATDGTCNIYSMSGQLMRKLALKKGTNTVSGLSKGVYIVNGNKVLVK